MGFFNQLQAVAARALDIHDSTGRCPRVQDFRHSFAVSALLRWYETDADVQSNLPKLALYMGHVNIVSTAYYLRWDAGGGVAGLGPRFERSCAGVIEGGAFMSLVRPHRPRARAGALLRGVPARGSVA